MTRRRSLVDIRFKMLSGGPYRIAPLAFPLNHARCKHLRVLSLHRTDDLCSLRSQIDDSKPIEPTEFKKHPEGVSQILAGLNFRNLELFQA